ncbi:MAG: hypothetical protein C6W58_16640 [Bacillaceae bacterium]|nr:MAG: hypothetical protein C6W58_16640 [Bacillaceae bacterium]
MNAELKNIKIYSPVCLDNSFLYVYDMIMPKNFLYILIGIPVLLVSSFFLLKIFNENRAND